MNDPQRYAKITISVDDGETITTTTYPKSEIIDLDSDYDEMSLILGSYMNVDLKFRALRDPNQGLIYKRTQESSSTKTKLLWRCGNRFSERDMDDSEMASLVERNAVYLMLHEVSQTLGYTDHTHIFVEHRKSPEGMVIYDCPGKRPN